MKAISYSLFGYGREKHRDCFDFNSYLRSFMVNMRLARLLYPDWKVCLHVDEPSYKAFADLFDELSDQNLINLEVLPPAPLCEAMLWRMRPIFETDPHSTLSVYSHVICRDLDSPLTYRERQCVQQWIDHAKAAHAICDSVSHTIPMLGGMVGFVPQYFTMRTDIRDFATLIQGYDLSQKGSDQVLLNQRIYPKFAQQGNDSITQHYMLGHANTFLSDYHKEIINIDLVPHGVPDRMIQSNDVCGHIGAAGWYEAPLTKFLRDNWESFKDFRKAESQYSDIFYWIKEDTF